MKRLDASRTWIGTSRKRATTLSFVLSRRGTVLFTVEQLSPTCRAVARFFVRGHKGVNRIRFASRIGGEKLGVGTYRITAHTPGQMLQDLILVVVSGGAPSPAELAALRGQNVCPETTELATVGFGSPALFSLGPLSAPEPGSSSTGSSGGEPSPSDGATEPAPSGVLGSTPIERTARALRPALIALLAASILLLGLASLPRVAATDSRLNDVLARHRVEIAGVGAAALVGVVIAFMLG